MKQGHWLTIDKAFKGYRRNLAALKSYPYPYVSGVDYSKPRVTGDGYKNGTEQMVIVFLVCNRQERRFGEAGAPGGRSGAVV